MFRPWSRPRMVLVVDVGDEVVVVVVVVVMVVAV